MNKPRISNGSAGALIATGLLTDGIQALLTFTVIGSIIATFVTLVAAFGFGMWLLMLGAYKGSKMDRQAVTAIAVVAVECVPFLSIIPGITLGLLVTIVRTRIEDAKKGGQEADPRKLAAVARLARMKAARSAMLQTARTMRETKRRNSVPSARQQ